MGQQQYASSPTSKESRKTEAGEGDREKQPPAHMQAHHAEKKNIIDRIRNHPLIIEVVAILLIAVILAGFFTWQDMQGKIFVEKAQISAPIISLAPLSPGVIDKFYVDEGDPVSQSQRIAKVGDQYVVANTEGVIIWIKNTPGQLSGPTDTIAQMIDPRQMRVVGRVPEDKGLSDIKPGQKVMFTVDAFPGKQYTGTIVSVANTPKTSDIVFSISDKREEKEFEIKAIFDLKSYPELKNGMSAKMWIYK